MKMAKLTLKRAFEKFFKEKGYYLGKPLSLIPDRETDKIDPFYEFSRTYRASVGATTFLKELKQGHDPFAIVQQCYRHPDVKYGRIGDGKHLGLFHLGGIGTRIENKEQMIKDFFEFINSLALDQNKIWASYFGGGTVESKVEVIDGAKTYCKDMVPQHFEEDIERKKIFLSMGIPEGRIIPLPYKSDGNFTNFSGIPSCDMYGGYRSHLYYEIGNPCSEKCYPEHDEKCNRFIEFAVFIDETIEKTERNGKWSWVPFYETGKFPFSVVGIGIQRTAMAVRNINRVEKLDFISEPLKKFIGKDDITGYPKEIYNLEMLLQSVLYLTADGAVPSTRSNRKRQFKELLGITLDTAKSVAESLNKPIEEIVGNLLNITADYLKEDKPELVNAINRAYDYILK